MDSNKWYRLIILTLGSDFLYILGLNKLANIYMYNLVSNDSEYNL